MDYHYKKSLAEFNLEDLNRDIEALSENSDLLLSKVLTIQLIIEELVTNIMKYGRKIGRDQSIEIELNTERGKIVLIIADNTDSFNPLLVEEPDTTQSAEERDMGGLGLFLVRKKVESLSYENKNGMNIVRAVLL